MIVVTPLAAHWSTSDFLMRRDALTTSGWAGPTPAQNSFNPPPVPVDSTTGVLNLPVLPKASATAVVKGKTVEEPTARIWSRDCAEAGAAVRIAPNPRPKAVTA